MHDVFISYSTKNTAIADAVCNRLEAGGVRCWYAPRDVQAGKGWAGELMRAIRKAKVFLLIYSEDYNQSRQVISELTEAVDAECTIVPFRVDQSDMNDDLAFYLKRIHWLDAINPPTQKQIESLYHHVAKVLGTTPPPPPPPLPPDPEEEKKRIEEEKRKKQEQQRKRKERRKKVLLKVVLPIVLAVCLCAVGVWLSSDWLFGTTHKLDEGIHQAIEQMTSQTPEETEPAVLNPTQETTQPEEPVEEGYQTIHFENMSRLSQYRYPFLSAYMISEDGEYILLENKESETFTMGQMKNGAVYLSGLELPEHNDIHMLQCYMSDAYDTVYFVNYENNTISSYDRVSRQWVNKEGTKLELTETEYIYVTTTYIENMLEENSHMEELLILVYDDAPGVECFSKWINVKPDGTTTVKDLSQYGLIEIINGVDRAGYSSILMVDKDRKLFVLDENGDPIPGLSHEEIMRDYLPYAYESDAICEDSRYYLSYDSNKNSAQIWDLHTGSRVYSRTFAKYACVYFSGPHEIIVYNEEDQSVFVHDLETGRETVLMGKSYFEEENETLFMKEIVTFCYFREYDVCVFAASGGYDDQGEGQWRIIVTDREGNVLAVSEELTTYNGSHYCYVSMLENLLLADMTLVDWNTAQPEDGIITELFRAEFTVDEAGNLVFK